MESAVLGAGVREVCVIDVQGAVLLVEYGNRMHEVQHVGSEAIVLQLHDCAALASWDTDQDQQQSCS